MLQELANNSPFARYYLQHGYSLENDISIWNGRLCCGATRAAFVSGNSVYKWTIERDRHGDPCEREWQIWQAAKREGWDEFLCPMHGHKHEVISFYGYTTKQLQKARSTIHNIVYDMDRMYEKCEEAAERLYGAPQLITVEYEVYEYDKVDSCGYYPMTEMSDEEFERMSHSPYRSAFSDIDAMCGFIECWGDDSTGRFCAKCEQYDINDLHGGNVGFIGDEMVIIDYAGFFGYVDDEDEDEEDYYEE